MANPAAAPPATKLLPRNELAKIAGEDEISLRGVGQGVGAARRTLFLEQLAHQALVVTPESTAELTADVALLKEEVATLTADVTANTADLAALTARVAALEALTPSATLTVSETITAGQLVNVASTGLAQKADASTPGKEAMAWAPDTITAPNAGLLYFAGKIEGLSGLTPGPVWLDPAVPGGITSTAPSTPGQVAQQVGIAVTADTVIFMPQAPLNL